MSPAIADARVPRHHLLAQLSEASTARTVVISAAAGSGKSTLVAQWGQADPRLHRVIALAPHLDDPASLAHLLVDALEGLGPTDTRTRAVVTATEPEFSAVLLPALRDLAASRTQSFVLVIDDAHLLQHKACHEVLAAVCEGTPPGSTLALVSRDAAPAWLARCRAEGRLVEIRNLAFDESEATRLFADVGVAIDDTALEEVVDHTEGWAVGLYLAALSRRDGGAITGDFRRFLGDYLQSQVLDALPEGHREFLLQTSGLDELSGPLCAAVTGRVDAEAVLEDLARRSQLVIELDGLPRRYRYHHLLAEFLRTRLVTEQPGSAPLLDRRAAAWFAEQGDRDAAIRFAKLAGDLELTGRLVWDGIVPCIGSGRPDRLRSWLGDLDDRHLKMDRWLSLAASWLALQEGVGPRMERWALIAEGWAGRDWRARVRTDDYSASVGALRLIIGEPLEVGVTLGSEVLEGLPTDSGFRPPAAWLRGVALTLVGRIDEGRASILYAHALARALGVPVIEADAHAFLGVLDILDGDRDAGVRHINRSIALMERHDLDRLATAVHTVTAQAFALAVVGDRPAAGRALSKARRLSGLTTDIAPWFAVTGRLTQARTAMLLGDGATARVLLAEAASNMTPDLQGTLVETMLVDTRDSVQAMAAASASGAALTSAELKVLQFLPSHLSFPEIGQHLFISQNTVKTHALSIYRKFAVSSRSEAVAKAQSLGLVEPSADNARWSASDPNGASRKIG